MQTVAVPIGRQRPSLLPFKSLHFHLSYKRAAAAPHPFTVSTYFAKNNNTFIPKGTQRNTLRTSLRNFSVSEYLLFVALAERCGFILCMRITLPTFIHRFTKKHEHAATFVLTEFLLQTCSILKRMSSLVCFFLTLFSVSAVFLAPARREPPLQRCWLMQEFCLGGGHVRWLGCFQSGDLKKSALGYRLLCICLKSVFSKCSLILRLCPKSFMSQRKPFVSCFIL